MPTAARLFAAICFGALALAFAYISTGYFTWASVPRYWLLLNGAVGVIMGWVFVGSRAGSGIGAAIGIGITAAVGILFWVFSIESVVIMLKRSMRGAYEGPGDAVVAVFDIFTEYALQFAHNDVAVLLVAGSVVSGLIVEFVGSRWS